jgi:hypothetical protein
MKRKPIVTVNLVRAQGSDTYEVVNDMTTLYAQYDIVHEKARVQDNMYGYFYVKVPKK